MVSKHTCTITFLMLVLCGFAFAGTYSGGAGTVQSPYLISDVDDIVELSETASDWTSHFVMTDNIELSCIVFDKAVIAPDTNDVEANHQGPCFSGTFDGNNFRIKNLTIEGNNDWVGFFGATNGASLITNLYMEDVSISCVNAVGAICGMHYGVIDNCYSSGSVSGSEALGGLCAMNMGRVNNSYSTVSVNGSQGVGGIVGFNYNIIENCHTDGTVMVNQHAGGLCGYNQGSIINCGSMVSITGGGGLGGLCGYNNSGTIRGCYAMGSVTSGNDSMLVGGLCGGNYSGTISKSFATGDVNCGEGGQNVGGLSGDNYQGTISDCYATGSVSGVQSVFLGGLCGNNYLGTVSNSYSTGTVTGGMSFGGFCGYSTGQVNSCYFRNTAGLDNGYGTPLTDSQMKQQASFVGWDFVGIWNIGDNQTYPFLRKYAAGDLNKDNTVNFIDLAMLANNWLN